MEKLPVFISDKNINAALILANGQYFFGKGIGAYGKTTGELCFNTAITGYQESLTDPSYTDQIITFTMPHIGNVGVNLDDDESQGKFAAGLVVREEITDQANFRAESDFNNWLEQNNITGISGIDTRYITKKIREGGVVTVSYTHLTLPTKA
mgnify:CR=1 FL=1